MDYVGNNGTIYVCTRIFNYNDKIQAECFEEELKKQLGYHIFIPFRDTDEHNLVGSERTKIVYDSDIARLDSGEIILLAALYDGICKDEGISFEIGYAYAKGIPIFVINTDFIWYAVGDKEFNLDPVIAFMANEFMQYFSIDSNDSFKNALINGQNKAFKDVASKIGTYLITEKTNKKEIPKIFANKHLNVFVDFGGGKYEYQRDYALWLKDKLSQHNLKVEVSDRYNRIDQCCLEQCGRDDIESLMSSDYYVCLGDEIEMCSGTAALLGLARANNKKVILYESSNIEIHGENGHSMKKNLIIDFSVDKVAKSKEEIVDIIIGELECNKDSKEFNFECLKKKILECNLCREKFGFDPHPILMGNVNSKIMQISQAPSQNVHNTLKPFNDASGRKLRNEWYHISEDTFYNPDNFYIAAIAHCYPGKSPNGGDRLPPKCCAKRWLLKEIELINNEIFILLGGKAANFFFPKEDFTTLVFRDNYINGKLTFILPHPSPLNAKWFKDNPEFLNSRVIQVEEKIHDILRI